jgi:DegV family protein with EDD domain
VQGAQLAAAKAPVPVRVVDSRSIGMALGYAALSAAAAAAAGESVDSVAAVAKWRAEAAHVVFYVHTLEHLRRGGRIGTASAWLGAALAIKPILRLTGGHIEPAEKVRTTARALARMVEMSAIAAEKDRDEGHEVDISVQHLDFAGMAEEVAAVLRERVRFAREVRVGELGAVVGAHVGPGTLAIIVSPRPARP